MTDAGHSPNPDRVAIYEITVKGYLHKSRTDWFDGMAIEPQFEAEGMCITQLTGEVVDQAALLGLLRKLYDLGLSLISMQRVELD